MKVLFLVENLDNKTAQHILQELQQSDIVIDVISYYDNKQQQCTICELGAKQGLSYKDRQYWPEDYDAALLWCWGTAHLGRQLLNVYESQGVHVLNSTKRTCITDSKIRFVKALQHAQAPLPQTLCIEPDEPLDLLHDISAILGKPPYVFKPDYGTQGAGVGFANTPQELIHFAQELRQSAAKSKGFIVQKFIGNPDKAITHYRLLAVGNEILPVCLRVTSRSKLMVSNIAAGSHVELLPCSKEMQIVALQAAKIAGLKVAGIDLMLDNNKQTNNTVILEVNDGPGTKTFESHGFKATQHIIDYFLTTTPQTQ